MKKFLAITLLIVMMTALILSGCAAPTPAPTTKPTPAPTTPAPAQKWELKFGTDDPPAFPWTISRNEWCKQVEQVTNGRVKITQYDSQTLFKAPDAYSSVVAGVGDLENSTMGYWPGLFPLTEVITLPLIANPSGVINGKVIWRLVQEFPALQKEFNEVKLLGFHTTEPFNLMTTKKAVRTVNDIKGLKIRSLGGPATEMTKALGAVPVTIPMPECYLALQKGTIDGIWGATIAFMGFKHYEVTKYYTHLPSTLSCHPLFINLKTWNSFPPDIQQQIMSVSGEKWAELQGKVNDDIVKSMWDDMKKAGYAFDEVSKPSPQDLAEFVNVAGKPIWNDWANKWKDKGPTQDILNRTLKLMAEVK